MGKKVELDTLSTEEKKRVLEVIQRDYNLRNKEKQRVERVQHNFKPTKPKDGDAPNLPDTCNMCGKKFIWLIRTKEICSNCGYSVCKSNDCSMITYNGRTCKICNAYALQVETNQWFQKQASGKFRRHAGAKIVRQLHKETMMQLETNSELSRSVMSLSLNESHELSSSDSSSTTNESVSSLSDKSNYTITNEIQRDSVKKKIRIFEQNNLQTSEKNKAFTRNTPKIRINPVNGPSFSADETEISTEEIKELAKSHIALFSFNGITSDNNVEQNYEVFSEEHKSETSESFSSSSSSSSVSLQNLSNDKIKVEGDVIKVKDFGKENENKFENVLIKVEDKRTNLDASLNKSEQLNKNEIDVKCINAEFNTSKRQTDNKINAKNSSASIANKQSKRSFSSENLEVLKTNETEIKKENRETNHSKTLISDKIHAKNDHNQSHSSSSSEKSLNPSYNGFNVKTDVIEIKDKQSSSSSSPEKSVQVNNKNNDKKDKDEHSSCAENELTEVSAETGYATTDKNIEDFNIKKEITIENNKSLNLLSSENESIKDVEKTINSILTPKLEELKEAQRKQAYQIAGDVFEKYLQANNVKSQQKPEAELEGNEEIMSRYLRDQKQNIIEQIIKTLTDPEGKTLEERMANSSINSSKQENTVEKKLSFSSSKPEIVVERNSSFASWEDLSEQSLKPQFRASIVRKDNISRNSSMRTSSMRTVEGNSGIHTKDQTRAQAEIESIFSGYLNAGTSKITEENLVEFNTDVNLTQNDLYSSSSSSGTHANYLEDNWDIQKTYDGRPSSSAKFFPHVGIPSAYDGLKSSSTLIGSKESASSESNKESSYSSTISSSSDLERKKTTKEVIEEKLNKNLTGEVIKQSKTGEDERINKPVTIRKWNSKVRPERKGHIMNKAMKQPDSESARKSRRNSLDLFEKYIIKQNLSTSSRGSNNEIKDNESLSGHEEALKQISNIHPQEKVENWMKTSSCSSKSDSDSSESSEENIKIKYDTVDEKVEEKTLAHDYTDAKSKRSSVSRQVSIFDDWGRNSAGLDYHYKPEAITTSTSKTSESYIDLVNEAPYSGEKKEIEQVCSCSDDSRHGKVRVKLENNSINNQLNKRKSLTIPKVVVLERNSDFSLSSSTCINNPEVAELPKKSLFSDEASVVSSNCSRSSRNFSIRSFSKENRLEIQRESRDINEIFKELNAAGIRGRLGKSKISASFPNKSEEITYPNTSYNSWAEEYSFTKEQEETEVYISPSRTPKNSLLKSDIEKVKIGTDNFGVENSRIEEDVDTSQNYLQKEEKIKDYDLSIGKRDSVVSSTLSETPETSKSINEKRIESVKAAIGFSLKRKSSTDKKHEINQKAETFAEEVRNNYVVNDQEESSTNKVMSFKQETNSKENSYSQPEIELKHKSGDAMQSTDGDSSIESNEIELEASIEAIKRKERTLSSSLSEKKESDNQNVSFNKKLLDTEYSDIENKLTSSESEDEISSEELELWMEQSFEKNKSLSDLQLESCQSSSSSESSSSDYSIGEDGSILV